ARAATAGVAIRAARGRSRDMTTAALVIGAFVAVIAVLLVAAPFLLEPAAADDRLREPGELDKRALQLAEEKDRALAALKELEFDHRTGKISDEDYRELIGPLRLRVAEALRALEPQAESTEERVRATS